jgi:cytidylate kinase
MDKYIITISRQFASLGRSIAQKMSKELGIEFYDRDIVEATAKRMGQSLSVISNEEEQMENRFFKRQYPLGMGIANMKDEIFSVQESIIQDLAKKESCIIVGRCGNNVLKNFDNRLDIFIYASFENRLKNCTEELKMDAKMASKMIKSVDKAREQYRLRYSKGLASAYDGYDIMIDSSRFGVDGTVALLTNIVKERLIQK